MGNKHTFAKRKIKSCKTKEQLSQHQYNEIAKQEIVLNIIKGIELPHRISGFQYRKDNFAKQKE